MARRIAILMALALAATSAFTHGDAPGELPFGRPGTPSAASRTIAVSMSDAMRFDPAEIRVRAGETVRIVVANAGKLRHEFVLGTMEELREHAEMMRKMPGMEHHEAHMASVPPGGKATIAWRFTKPGTFHYACLEPGHLEAGMVGKVVVR
jgi:uncharacterized cupredoxin-like copper-binding protein